MGLLEVRLEIQRSALRERSEGGVWFDDTAVEQ
jgi:hypothetical protein